MITIFFLLFFMGSLLSADSIYNVETAKEPGALRIMTFNVRYKHKEDQKQHNWDKRLPLILQMIEDFQPDVIGMQEPLYSQIKDLEKKLDDYKWVGKSRGKKLWGLIKIPGSEYNPVFYNKKVLKLKKSKTFWLNRDNEKYEPDWGATLPRICTRAQFEDTENRLFYVFNTHLDHSSSKARKNGFEVVARKAHKRLTKAPVILSGDLNAGIGFFEETMEQYGLVDAKAIAKKSTQLGTFNNWKKSFRTIDYLLTFKDAQDEILQYAVIERKDKRFLSDHNPVFIDIKLAE